MNFGVVIVNYLQINYQMQQNNYISTKKKNTGIRTYMFIPVFNYTIKYICYNSVSLKYIHLQYKVKIRNLSRIMVDHYVFHSLILLCSSYKGLGMIRVVFGPLSKYNHSFK